MTTTPPPASPERPSLEQAPGKPDIVARLQARRHWWANPPDEFTDEAAGVSEAFDESLVDDLADAIATIEALRAANLRHCHEERELKDARARIAELERLLRVLIEGASVNLDDLREEFPEYVQAHYDAAGMLGIDMAAVLACELTATTERQTEGGA